MHAGYLVRNLNSKYVIYLEMLSMPWLNSGNFEIFYPSEFYSIFSSRVKSALKIIPNDTNIGYHLQNYRNENRLFNFCVGKTVGGKSREFLRVYLMMKSILMTIFYLGIQLMALNLPDSAITSGTDSQKAGTFILKISSKIYFSQLYF